MYIEALKRFFNQSLNLTNYNTKDNLVSAPTYGSFRALTCGYVYGLDHERNHGNEALP